MDFLQGKKLIQKGQEVSADVALKKKSLILYYFVAKDSEACKVFETKLMDVYEEALLRKVELGIIAVCGDIDQESRKSCSNDYKEWFCLQHDDDLAHILLHNYGITHVPALIVVRKNGMLVTRDGVKDVEEIGANVLVTWSE